MKSKFFESKMLIGILVCLIIAVPAWLLGLKFPIIGGPVFGILIGMLLAFFKRPAVLEKGIKFTSKYILQYSIILLGFEMNLFNVIRVGGQSLMVMLFTLSASFLTAYFVGKAMKIDGKTSTLIGVGTSICGGSAIAATAPVIRADDEDVAQAISTIFLFNIIAVFIFPALGHLMGLSDTGFGMWPELLLMILHLLLLPGHLGVALLGNNTALAFATIVKLTRTLMIVPITLTLAIYTTRKITREKITLAKAKAEALAAGTSSEDASVAAEDNNFNFVKIFPWFVLGFVLTAILNTFLPIPAYVSEFLVKIGKFMIVMAMTAIGLNTNLKKLLTNGLKPIGLGLCCWFAVATVSLIIQHVIGMI